ncbi:hypothetical protein ASC94_04450 [Massilia sp. Root418]|uniref:hypothetical protein n=1 Tax=Massilia sp. Root418 TaxID=1736532 RepID=UPI0006FBCCFA|nr:hypothetical protein [Massilia sp. Root418]KQX01846.1 hypothetical protein ASC94_04450 [Massilia sp. Root418]
MDNLTSALTRLYLPEGAAQTNLLAQRAQGQTGVLARLVADGRTRAVAIPFRPVPGGLEAQHWTQLCDMANALQAELGLPAPAVSIAGDRGYGLWLSLAKAVPEALAQRFAALLWARYVPDAPAPDSYVMDLPPCLHQGTGKWAAFINPGLGASFAEESGLELPPPHAGQAALLDGLHSIGEAQFTQALTLLQPAPAAGQPAAAPGPGPGPTPAPAPAAPALADGLLLKDATLEDIVAFLHAKNIEPTFRHLIRP